MIVQETGTMFGFPRQPASVLNKKRPTPKLTVVGLVHLDIKPLR
jgi:hypothetical protein